MLYLTTECAAREMSTPPVGSGDTHVRMVVRHAFPDGCTGWETGFTMWLLNWIPEHVRVKAAASRIGWLVPRPARPYAVFLATLLANYLPDAVAAFSCLFSSCISCNLILCAAALSAAALNRSS